ASDELAAQPVEQFGMRGLRPVDAKITRGADNALAEMMLPETIDKDAGRQRMVRVRDPLGQGNAPFSVARIRRQLQFRAKRGEGSRSDGFTLLHWVAPVEAMRLFRCGELAEVTQGHPLGFGKPPLQVGKLFAQAIRSGRQCRANGCRAEWRPVLGRCN